MPAGGVPRAYHVMDLAWGISSGPWVRPAAWAEAPLRRGDGNAAGPVPVLSTWPLRFSARRGQRGHWRGRGGQVPRPGRCAGGGGARGTCRSDPWVTRTSPRTGRVGMDRPVPSRSVRLGDHKGPKRGRQSACRAGHVWRRVCEGGTDRPMNPGDGPS